MEAFALCLLVFLAVLNIAVAISTSLVLIKIYEITRNQEERYQLEEEAKRQARGLIDVTTPQNQYTLRAR